MRARPQARMRSEKSSAPSLACRNSSERCSFLRYRPGRLSSVSISYPLKSLGVIASEIAALKDAGIKTAGALLEAAKTPKGRKELANATSLDPKRILELANKADRLRVKG